jgi:addiction module RelE/StbE family toxin
MKRVTFHSSFHKDLYKSPAATQKKFAERFRIFMADEFDPILSNHSLQGSYQGFRSINVSGNLRAIFKINDCVYTFYRVGTHAKLYR